MRIGAYGALISTVDGHEIAYSLKRDPADTQNIDQNSLFCWRLARASPESLYSSFVNLLFWKTVMVVVSLRVNDIDADLYFLQEHES